MIPIVLSCNLQASHFIVRSCLKDAQKGILHINARKEHFLDLLKEDDNKTTVYIENYPAKDITELLLKRWPNTQFIFTTLDKPDLKCIEFDLSKNYKLYHRDIYKDIIKSYINLHFIPFVSFADHQKVLKEFYLRRIAINETKLHVLHKSNYKSA